MRVILTGLLFSCWFDGMTCRQMCGIHYRFDGQEGLLLGEMVGVRILQQVREHTDPKIAKNEMDAIYLKCMPTYRMFEEMALWYEFMCLPLDLLLLAVG